MKRLCVLLVLSLALTASGLSPTDMTGTKAEGIQRLADSAAASMSPPGVEPPRKIKIIKKDVNYSTFAALAVAMMGFIALILTTSQTYNPGE
jgi:hypothetical protein